MNRITRLFVFVLFAVAIVQAANSNPQTPIGKKIPVSFEINAGQAEPWYAFLLNRQGMNVGFRQDGVDFQIVSESGKSVRFTLQFAGAAAGLDGEEPLAGKVNYLRGSDSSRWLRNIQTFGKVRYKSAFRDIDLVFYGNAEEIEHDFVVRPGADSSVIQLQLGPNQQVEISPEGDAYLRRDGATLKIKKPFAYQDTAEGRTEVVAHFKLSGQNLGFELGDYNHDLPLVIDPALVFSTYLADGTAPITGVATDAAGNTYLVGQTYLANMPTVNPIQGSLAGQSDIYVSKLNADGTVLLYSTYFGGNDYDGPVGIQVDSAGDVIFAGSTWSSDFPVKNGIPSGTPAYVTPLGFVTSLTPDGSSLNYSTLLGHTKPGYAMDASVQVLAIGQDGSAFVAGTTDDPDFPVTPGAIHMATPGYPDRPLFLTKFLPDGSLAYSGIIGNPEPQNGGGGMVGAMGLAIDAQGAAYLHGSAGTLWPTTERAYQTSIPGDSPYAAPFVTKVLPDGSALAYSTFLGGSTGMSPAAIIVNSAGEAWVTGAGADDTFPTTPDAFVGPQSGIWSPYLARLSADGTQLLYSTYMLDVQAGPWTYPLALKFDGSSHIWVAGYISNQSLPLVHPLESILSGPPGSTAGFILEFDDRVHSLLFSTYFGGQASTQIWGLAIDPADRIHVAGWTGSSLYTTSGAYLSSVTPAPPHSSYQNPFAAMIDPMADSSAICLEPRSSTYTYFPATRVGAQATASLTVRNCGTATLNLVSFESSDSHFMVPAQQNGCTFALAPDATCSFQVAFTPTAETTVTAKLKLVPSGVVVPGVVSLSGTGATPHASPMPTQLDFPMVLLGNTASNAALIENSGDIPLHIDLSGITVTGDYNFKIVSCAENLPRGSWCWIQVNFVPTEAGERDGTLTVPTDDPNNLLITIPLYGAAVAAYPVPVLNSLSWNTAPIGATEMSEWLSGSGFFPESVVKINGRQHNIRSFISQSSIWIDIDPAELAQAGELDVTVVNPAPGGGESNALKLTVYRSVAGAYRQLVYNKKMNLLYATVPAGASADANTIVGIDPSTGVIVSRISVGNNPNRLALSYDDQYLFVGVDDDHAVQRVNCSTHSVEATFTLPNDALFSRPETAYQIVGVPGSAKSFVAILQRPGDIASLALFGDTGMINQLPYDYPDWLKVNSIAFADDPHTLYAMPFETTGPFFFKMMTIDADGLHYTRPSGTNVGEPVGSNVFSDGTYLYTDNGSVFDPISRSKLRNFDLQYQYYPELAPDVSNGKLFAVSYLSALALDAYSLSDYSHLGTLAFDAARIGASPADLVRWGSDGLAFLSGLDYDDYSATSLNLVRSSMVPGTSTAIPLTITSISPDKATANGPDLSISVLGTGFRRDTAVTWNNTPLSFTFVSRSEMTLNVPATLLHMAGPVTIALSNASSGGPTVSTSFTVAGIPGLALSNTALDFGSVKLNSPSAAQTVTLTNNGTKQVQISGVDITGDFSKTATCASTLAVNATCTVSVIFTPAAVGTRSGRLTITDDADDSPQTVALTGVGADFALGVADEGSASVAVDAGQDANYDLVLSSAGGFSGTVNLTCTGAPQYATCTVTPSSVNLTAGASPSVAVKITTSQTTNYARVRGFGGLFGAIAVAFGLVFVVPGGRNKCLRKNLRTFVVIAVLAPTAGLCSCGGGGSSGSGPQPPPTAHYVAAGSYTLQVTAKNGSTERSLPITLVVR